MGPRLLVIQHEATCPPGWFGDWLTSAGVNLDVLPASEGHEVPDRLTEHVGLVVLGGPMAATDDQAHRWLAPTRALMAGTVAAGAPVLGICLGHQLAAVALGGEVGPNPHGHSHGLTPYRPLPAAADDELLGDVADGAPLVQWNNDVAHRLPAGSVPLALAPDGTVQAARYGPAAWGVQFHPEASPQIFRGWTVDKPAAEQRHDDGVDTERAVAQVTEHADDLQRTWEPVARRFADIVHRAARRA